MTNDYRIWCLAYRCLEWYQHLQNEWNINRKLMELGADDAEPTHITGEGGETIPNVIRHVKRHRMIIIRFWTPLPNVRCRV